MVKIHFINLPEKSNEVFFRVFTHAGWLSEERECFGLGHLLDHYINGRIFQRYHSYQTNAHIDNDFLWFSLNTTKSQCLKQIKTFLKQVVDPDFSDQLLLDFERQSLLNEVRTDEAVIYSRVFQEVLETSYKGYINSFRQIPNVEKFTLNDLISLHRCLFDQTQIEIFVGGHNLSRMQKNQICDIVKNFNLTGSKVLKPREIHRSKGEPLKELRLPKEYRGQAYVYLTAGSYSYQEPIAKRIAVNILLRELSGSGRNSPFIPLRKLGIYQLNYNHIINKQFASVVLSVICLPDKVGAATDVINTALRRLSEEKLPSATIEKHKREDSRYLKSLTKNNQDYFSEALYDLLYRGKYQSYRDRMKAWEGIDGEFVRNVCKTTFSPENISRMIYI